ELIAGRPQNLIRHTLQCGMTVDRPMIVDVRWKFPPKRETVAPQRSNLLPLLDAVERPDEFSKVLTHWLGRHGDWRVARASFFESLAKQRSYSASRLINAANMFDVLPDCAVPKETEISEELRQARDESRKLFRNLPPSIERDSVLNAL